MKRTEVMFAIDCKMPCLIVYRVHLYTCYTRSKITQSIQQNQFAIRVTKYVDLFLRGRCHVSQTNTCGGLQKLKIFF